MQIRLQSAIECVAGSMSLEAGDWWIIGSAAMSLCGVETEAKDVDVFASEATIAATLSHLSLEPLPPSHDPLFRSKVFARHTVPDSVPVEFMGGFRVNVEGVWQPFAVRTRREIMTASGPVYVPELLEQIAILELFGRDKDLKRADLIREFLAAGGL